MSEGGHKSLELMGFFYEVVMGQGDVQNADTP